VAVRIPRGGDDPVQFISKHPVQFISKRCKGGIVKTTAEALFKFGAREFDGRHSLADVWFCHRGNPDGQSGPTSFRLGPFQRDFPKGYFRSSMEPSSGFPIFYYMTDPLEEVLAPAAIERAMGVFEQLKDRGHGEIVQARKAVHEHIYGLIAKGETDEHRLVVAGLAHLNHIRRQVKK
jgi:hypothetical protein